MAFQFNAILKFSSPGVDRALNNTRVKFTRLTNSVQKANSRFRKLKNEGLTQAKKGLDQLKPSLNKASSALQDIRGGALAGAAATAPFAIGVAAATKSAADFEEQMSIVGSVLLKKPGEIQDVVDVTKKLGATTAFTAKEAGQGAEFLARAGFTTTQIVSALPGVLNAAAASGVGLAEASDIVANQIGAFGLEAKDATKIADTLALTTAKTNTDFIQLGEALKLGAPAAKQAGISFEETAFAMGVLANSGIKASLGGTALKNALNKLAKPTKESIKLFGGKAGLEAATTRMVDGVKNLLPIEVIMANAAKAINKMKSPLDKTAAAAEIFGLRGLTAFSAFSSKLLDTTTITAENQASITKILGDSAKDFDLSIGKAVPSLVLLRKELGDAEGVAKGMANLRLDNVKGQFTLFQSAVSGLSIELGSLLQGTLKSGLSEASKVIGTLAIAFQTLGKGPEAEAAALKGLDENTQSFVKQNLKAFQDFAAGFVEGFKEVKTFAKETFESVRQFLKPFLGDAASSPKQFGKLAAKIIAVGAVAAPILAGLAAAMFVIGPIVVGIAGSFKLLVATFSIGFRVILPLMRGLRFAFTALSPILRTTATTGGRSAGLLASSFSKVGSILSTIGRVALFVSRKISFGFQFLTFFPLKLFGGVLRKTIGLFQVLALGGGKAFSGIAKVVQFLATGSFRLLLSGIAKVGSFFNILFSLGTKGFGLLATGARFLFGGLGAVLRIGLLALPALKAGFFALAIPVGIVALKVIAIGAAIAGVILLGDKLLRVFGFLEGESLFDRSIDSVKNFGSTLKDAVSGPGAALESIKDFFTGGPDEKQITVRKEDVSPEKSFDLAIPPGLLELPDGIAGASSGLKDTLSGLSSDSIKAETDPNFFAMMEGAVASGIGKAQAPSLGDKVVKDSSAQFGSIAKPAEAQVLPFPKIETDASIFADAFKEKPTVVQSKSDLDNVIPIFKGMDEKTAQMTELLKANLETSKLIAEGVKISDTAKVEFVPDLNDSVRSGVKAEQDTSSRLLPQINSSIGKIAGDISAKQTSFKEDLISSLTSGLDKIAQAQPRITPEQTAGFESQKIAAENLQQKAIVSPPSEERIVNSVSRRLAANGGGGASSPDQMVIKADLKARIRGKDLLLTTSRAMVENTEARGRTVEPRSRRRVLQDGVSMGVNCKTSILPTFHYPLTLP